MKSDPTLLITQNSDPAVAPTPWTVEIYEDAHGRSPFANWMKKELSKYEQTVLVAAIERVLRVIGSDICESEWGKPLGKGLYEFRVRHSLHALNSFGMSDTLPKSQGLDRTVLLRVFVAFYGQRAIILLHGLNKRLDSSRRRQDREIKKARRLLADWKRRN